MANLNAKIVFTIYEREYFCFSTLKRFCSRIRSVTAVEACPHSIFYCLGAD